MFVITGATGNTGSVVAQTLIDQGHPVRVVVRSPQKGQVWKEKGAEVALGDLFDQASMNKAFEGARAAYLMMPPDVHRDDFFDSRKEISDVLFNAARHAGLGHVVLLSSVGADLDHGSGPILTARYLESLFEKSDMASTALRPGYFMDNWRELGELARTQGILPSMIQPLDFAIDMTATQDIGKVAAQALLTPIATGHRVLEIKGKQKYSSHDIAKAFATVLGRDVQALAPEKSQWKEILMNAGMPGSTADIFVEMYENINNGRIEFKSKDAVTGSLGAEEFVRNLMA